LRTLQRKVKQWRASEGPSCEVFFSQQPHPGRLCASDFTHMEELGSAVQGQSLPHLIYLVQKIGQSSGTLWPIFATALIIIASRKASVE